MTTSLPFSFLIAGAVLLAAGAPAAAQTSVPTDNSRPVVTPGKAGPAGSEGPARPPASPAINVTIAEIMERPADYAGRNVTVTSEVEEVFTPWSIQLDEDRLLTGGIDNDMLVIGMHPLASMGFEPSWKNRLVRVTGTLRLLQAADFRREYGRGVDDKLFRRYEGKPALIATSMTLADKSAGTNPATGMSMECRPSAVDCPVTESSGSSVTTTDSLPIGSAPEHGDPTGPSGYPTSPGSGTLGSGSTGAPAGPGPGPTLGIGR